MSDKNKDTFVRQLDTADCGVACLASIIRYYGGDVPLERLRDYSGTRRQGTTLLGLYQAAQQLGFRPEGWQAESVAQFKASLRAPVILHVRFGEGPQERHLNHFLVCYAWDDNRQCFCIGDPAVGLVEYTEAALAQRWPSLALLTLAPTAQLGQAPPDTRRKRQWLYHLVQPDVPALAVATGLGLVTTVLGLATALFSQQLIDHLLPQRDFRRLWLGLGMLAGLLLVRAALGWLRGWLLARQGQDLSNRLTGRFFETLLYLPKRFFDGRKTGDFITRLNDTGRIQQAVNHLVGTMTINLLVVVAALGYVWLYSRLLGSCMLIYSMLYWLVARRFHQPILSGQRAVMGAAALNESQYIDTLQGIAEVKAAGQERFFAQLTQVAYGHLQAQGYWLRLVGLRFATAAEVLNAFFWVGTLAFTVSLVVHRALTLGELVAILSITGAMVPALTSLSLTVMQLQEARVAFERMYEYSKNEPELAEDEAAPALALQELAVQEVSFGFAGQPPLLDAVSLRLARGELLAIVGQSGTGKTTLFQLLQRFYEPSQGRVLVNGTEWQAITTRSWRRVVSAVAQHPKLFNGTLLDNVCLSDPTTGLEALVAFCREWGFDAYFEALPQGYYTALGEDGVALSGGQRQLVAFARALYARPQLLLLDEPTAAMDECMEQFVLRVLDRLRPTTSIILITHKLALVEGASQVWRLSQGHLQPLAASIIPTPQFLS